MSSKNKLPLVQIANKNGTTVGVTDLEELKVSLGSLGEDSSGAVITIDTIFADVARTPNFLRSSAVGSVAVAAHSISVHNAGVATGQVLSVNILAGETLNFDAGGNGNMFTAGSLDYDGTGTDLVIIYVT